jgi:hypothetical protein
MHRLFLKLRPSRLSAMPTANSLQRCLPRPLMQLGDGRIGLLLDQLAELF